MIGADAFDGADGAGAEAAAGAVGDAEVHRHADQGEVDAGEVGFEGVGGKRRIEKGRDAFVGLGAPIAREQDVGDFLEFGIEDIGGAGFAVFFAQGVEFFGHGQGPGGQWPTPDHRDRRTV